MVTTGCGETGALWSSCQTRRAEVALEAAQCFAATLSFGLFAGEVGGGVGVVESFGDREAVEGAVELASHFCPMARATGFCFLSERVGLPARSKSVRVSGLASDCLTALNA
jgi:hypothetical protein